MTHDFIAAHDVVARYVADRLPENEEREFEAHLVDCAQCSGSVEQELALRDGLVASAAERPAMTTPAAPVLRDGDSRRWWQMAAAALAIVTVGLALALALTRSALRTSIDERAEQQHRIDDLQARASERPPKTPKAPTDRLMPTSVLALTAVRGASDAINTFTLDANQPAPLVVLTVDVPSGEYAVTLKDGNGREVWSGDHFRSSS